MFVLSVVFGQHTNPPGAFVSTQAENTRFLKVVLYQGFAKDEFNTAAATLEMEVAENPGYSKKYTVTCETLLRGDRG